MHIDHPMKASGFNFFFCKSGAARLQGWLSIGVILFLQACIFKYPFYAESDLVDLPVIKGNWYMLDTPSGNPDTLVEYAVTQLAKGHYFVNWKAGNTEEYMYLHSFKLKDQFYVDAQQIALDIATKKYEARVPVHTIWKYFKIDRATFVMVNLNYDKVMDQLKNSSLNLKTETEAVDQKIVVSERDELQQFLLSISSNSKMWGEGFTFVSAH